MKIIRTLVASALLVLSSSAALADDYQYLTITQTGTESSFSVSNIQKITFEDADMVLQLSNGQTQRLPLSGLQKMFFAASPTGIAAVAQTQSRMQFDNGMLRATVAPGEHIIIYNMKGEAVFSANSDASFDLHGLQKGVYIVKVGNETRKVVNK